MARNNPELIAGNFAGDSYKGSLDKFDHLPAHILKGIKLHRFIDNYTDTSPTIRKAGKIFQQNGISKVTYIACDILLDHFITKNWSDYSTQSFDDFVSTIYAETDKDLIYLEADFHFLYDRLKAYGWLFDYHKEAGIEKILNQFSRRIGFNNDLPKCMSVYLKEKEEIDTLFGSFMSEIVENSKQFIHDTLQ